MQSLIAEALAVDPINVHVLCPYCGKVHRHGSFRDITLMDYGSRVPHCSWPDKSPNGEYRLVSTPKTIRKDTPITAKDLKPWEGRQKELQRSIHVKNMAGKKSADHARILEAIKGIRERGGNLYLWNIALHSEVKQDIVRAWMYEHGLGFVRSLKGRQPGHCHAWQIINLDKAGPEIRALFDVAAVWARTIHCQACGEFKPGFGAEYYSGDVCRCADCRKADKALPYPSLCGAFEGIIGKTIEQYPGQLRRRS
jgi:hypothetical protein